jgi:segregation and condensation protein B
MARLEALLFVADEPLTLKRMVQFATLADTKEAETLLDRLNAAFDASHSAFRVERVATGFRLLTRREFVVWLDKLHQRQAALKLSPPMLETLAIVAYRQPLTRAEVEAIRGVQSAEMLKQLMERELVRIAGEDDSLGRPFLYETTRKFLELYGLQSLNDLPMSERLRRPGASSAAAITETTDSTAA